MLQVKNYLRGKGIRRTFTGTLAVLSRDTVSYVAKNATVSKDIAERKVNSFWN